MSRRRQSEKRKISPDPIYGSVDIEKFTNRLMKGGKKSIARKALYDAMEKINVSENLFQRRIYLNTLLAGAKIFPTEASLNLNIISADEYDVVTQNLINSLMEKVEEEY